MFACLRSAGVEEGVLAIAHEFSPRFERVAPGCVVLDVSGLGRLLGDPHAIGAELAHRAAPADPREVGHPGAVMDAAPGTAPRAVSRYGIRIRPDPGILEPSAIDLPGSVEIRTDPGPAGKSTIRVAVAPTQTAALLLSHTGSALTVATDAAGRALAALPIDALRRLMAEIHGTTIYRTRSRMRRLDAAPSAALVWPSWESCERVFDVLQRWGLQTLGEFGALRSEDLSSRTGQAGVRLQRLARGIDPRPLVPDPDAPRFLERLDLEWPIEGLEPLSFVLARLIEPLSAALERAGRGAAALRLDLRLVDRTTHARVLLLPVALREARVLRTLLLLDLESHPPQAAIDTVTLEIDPAPGRVVQYSLLEPATASPETLATLTARLGALVGESRCGTPVPSDTHRPDAFEMRPLVAVDDDQRLRRPAAPTIASTAGGRGPAAVVALRRFRPPVAVRVAVESGRPVHVAIDRRGMPGGRVAQAAGPWRTSGAWWANAATGWNRDEWDIALGDGSICRLFRERDTGRWFMEAIVD